MRILKLLVIILGTLFTLGCCKAQEDNMQCDDNCFHMKGQILCLPDNTPLKNIDLRFRAGRSTGVGMGFCKIIKAKTNKNGEFEFKADLTNFVGENDSYSFDLFFKDKKYVNSDASVTDYERTLAKFYDVDSTNVDRYIDTTFYLEKD